MELVHLVKNQDCGLTTLAKKTVLQYQDSEPGNKVDKITARIFNGYQCWETKNKFLNLFLGLILLAPL
ncbi:MAG: hypothetical protein EBS53_17170, partial [Bacteroidetes bacterium]|nr:hypothetical protein [Bacteroidota bacterium]